MGARRAPRPEDRGQAAEQTRERILTAAVAEFGAMASGGAPTAGIAARAGVNQQLISYYFGGKQGLLDELRRRWQEIEAGLVTPDTSFADSIGAHLDATLDNPDWARLTVWQALGDCPFTDEADGRQYADRQRAKMADSVEKIRQRQENGEVTDEVDARFALLTAYAVVFAPITMPHFVRALFGDDPLSPETRTELRNQLIKLLGRSS
jgi:TetR/AcrR family transcriptional regulator